MSKIRIDVAGWEAFTGFLGTVEFENGVSVLVPTELEVKRLGANIRIVKVNSDEQVGPATTMVDTRNVSAVVETSYATEQNEPSRADEPTGHTEDSLTELAEVGGIKALRKVAADYGVKGVSISELTKEILEAQKKAK